MITKPQEVSLAIDKNAIAHALGTKKVYSPQDLANLLGVSVQTLHNWRKSRPKLLDDPVKVTGPSILSGRKSRLSSLKSISN